MKKVITIVAICLAAVFVIGHWVLIESTNNTVDFYGMVKSIRIENGVYIFEVEHPDTTYTVTATEKTKTKPYTDGAETVAVADIRIGDVIWGDYKDWFADENEAKYLKIMPN